MDIRKVERREILRYLGYHGKQPDELVANLVEEALAELGEKCEPRHIWREFPLVLGADNAIEADVLKTCSRNLTKNLKDCDRIIFFAATLGTGADYLIQRYTRLQMSKAVVMQAAGAAMIEEYCDEVCGQLKAGYESRGLFVRPRFSPGYGDFPLACQKELLGALEAGKRIGIKLTDSLLMMPSKSVSAVMGVSEKPYRCEVKGCEACAKKDCMYRRES